MEKRFVSLWFPHLITDWFEHREPELKEQPLAVCSQVHGRMVVRAVNVPALQKGILPAMTLADARAIFPGLQKKDEIPLLAAQLLQRIARWCIRFSPVCAVDAEGGVIIDCTGCCHLWGGEKNYLTTILQRIHQKGFRVKAAMADTIGAAWAFARYRKTSCIIAAGKHAQALDTLPVQCLRLDDVVTEKLHKLGLHTVAQISQMAPKQLRRRFGAATVTKLQQALGLAEEWITPVQEQVAYTERMHLMDTVRTLPAIEHILTQLLESLVNRVQQEGKGVRKLVLTGYCIDGEETSVQVSTASASCNSRHLLGLFRLCLGNIQPHAGIELFVLDAPVVEDYQPLQQAFWKSGNGINTLQLGELADRIAGKSGVAAERYLPAAHYLPERSFTRTTSLQEQPAISWKTDRPRPVILLSTPERIQVTAPIPDYPPMMFRYKGRLHKVVHADGPERIEQEWWIAEGEHRDYYTVEDEAGARYWLFRSGHYDPQKQHAWFIHGFFA